MTIATGAETMIQTIAFNTGRKYAANGQPISAAFDPETGTIAFVDHARMIHGVIRDRTRLSQAAVMAAYDANAYKMPHTMEDLALVKVAHRMAPAPAPEPVRIKLEGRIGGWQN
jgi:hypothetical protein